MQCNVTPFWPFTICGISARSSVARQRCGRLLLPSSSVGACQVDRQSREKSHPEERRVFRRRPGDGRVDKPTTSARPPPHTSFTRAPFIFPSPPLLGLACCLGPGFRKEAKTAQNIPVTNTHTQKGDTAWHCLIQCNLLLDRNCAHCRLSPCPGL